MQLKARLLGVNRLLSDVYGQATLVSDLLADDLSPAQVKRLKETCLEQYLGLFVFALRCHFLGFKEGMLHYAILSAEYGLDTPHSFAVVEGKYIGKLDPASVKTLCSHALHMLAPVGDASPLASLAQLAARRTLALPPLPTAITTLAVPASIDQFEITEEPIALLLLHRRVNNGLGISRGEEGYVKRSSLQRWLIENGYLEEMMLNNGRKKHWPTEKGRSIGIITKEKEHGYGPFFAVLYTNAAQAFLYANLPTILTLR